MDRRLTWIRWGTRCIALASAFVLGGAMALAQVNEQPEQPDKAKAAAPDAEDQRDAVTQPDRPAPRRAPARTGEEPAADPAAEPRPARRAPDRATEELPADEPGRRPARTDDRARPPRAADATEREDGRRAEARPGLGIEFDAQAEGGLTVGKIEQESIAAQSGLRTGDVIVSIDGRMIRNPRQFQAYLSGQYGRRVPVIIERGDQRYTVQLAMGEARGDAAWLGVYLQEGEEGQRGAQITQVYPAGPAARAGLRRGDTIVRVNEQAIASTPDLISTVESLDPQSQAQFVVLRGDRELTLGVTLGRRDQYIFYGGDEDYGGGGEGRGYGEGDDDFYDIPPHAMQLEHDRRMAEQHQRIEQELIKLQEEVRKLREGLRPDSPPARPAPQE